MFFNSLMEMTSSVADATIFAKKSYFIICKSKCINKTETVLNNGQ